MVEAIAGPVGFILVKSSPFLIQRELETHREMNCSHVPVAAFLTTRVSEAGKMDEDHEIVSYTLLLYLNEDRSKCYALSFFEGCDIFVRKAFDDLVQESARAAPSSSSMSSSKDGNSWAPGDAILDKDAFKTLAEQDAEWVRLAKEKVEADDWSIVSTGLECGFQLFSRNGERELMGISKLHVWSA